MTTPTNEPSTPRTDECLAYMLQHGPLTPDGEYALSFAGTLENELQRAQRELAEAQQWIDSEPDWKDKYNANYLLLQQERDSLAAANRELKEISDKYETRYFSELKEKQKLAASEAKLRAALEGVVNSCVHPDVAIRAVLVDLKPIREALSTDPAHRTGRLQLKTRKPGSLK